MVTKDNENHSETFAIFERNLSSYKNQSSRFLIGCRNFERQYAPFYNIRLNTNTGALQKKIKKVWGQTVSIKKLCDIAVGEDVAVIGTIFKHMELQPSILKEISEEHHLITQPIGHCYVDDDDFLILEDDVQRITLKGNVSPGTHVTGIVVAVLGCAQDDGTFTVADICYLSVPMPVKRPLLEEDRYVMIVSGLGVGSPDTVFPLQLLVDYVTGLIGEESDQKTVSNIVRIIIAGNSISENLKDMDFSSKANYLTRKTKAGSVEAIKALDDILAALAFIVISDWKWIKIWSGKSGNVKQASIEVDLMPGEYDPANHLVPQQPLHSCMFPKSSACSTFHLVTNPYEASVHGIRFLGTSGQNIKDILSYSKLNEPMEAIESTLKWGHLSPTAPDTLHCYPYADEDPFVIMECPHVYFAGNMPKLNVKKYGPEDNLVTMMAVPKFSETFSAILVNLKSLSAESFQFLG